MSLSIPHPHWLHAGSPFEVRKAVIACRMLSGRYRTDRLSRHWTKDNPNGYCRLPGCHDQVGDLQHILLSCTALTESQAGMIKMWSSFMVGKPSLFKAVKEFTIVQENLFMQFLLDPSCIPLVLLTKKSDPNVLQQCLCFAIHLTRTKLLHQLQFLQ